MIFIFLIDYAICKKFIKRNSHYFFLHAIVNTIVCYFSFPDVYRTFIDPINAFTGQSQSMMANNAVISIHLYHIIRFKLSKGDIIHHIIFVSICCGLAIKVKYNAGVANNLGCFFLSGLPGGIDYFLLVAEKHNWINKLTEKKWNAYIQGWIRGPSMAIYGFLLWQTYILNKLNISIWIAIIAGSLHFINGQYYSINAVYNYGIWKEREKKY